VVGEREYVKRAYAARQLLLGNERKQEIPKVRDIERPNHADPERFQAPSTSRVVTKPPPSLVEVLLSTHNGERYVGTQIASVLTQTHANLRVMVRDDGSTDRTVAIVRAIASDDARVQVLEGPWLGAAKSFMSLLAAGGEDARWFAFCDQDDVWLPDKLSRAIAALEGSDDRPALYGSAMLHVRHNLRPLATSQSPLRACFDNALVQNVIPGCTMVFNQAARRMSLEGVPYRAPLHDWWLYLVVSAFGSVTFDDEITILHRIHAGNMTPAPIWRHWPRRFAAHATRPRSRRRSAMVARFFEVFSERLDGDKRATVELLLARHNASWLSRALYAARSPVFRQPALDNAIFRVLFTLGRF
jgi:glycosyltransferase involved in cell wall biosynthesis